MLIHALHTWWCSQKRCYPDWGAGSAGLEEPWEAVRPHPSSTRPLANPRGQSCSLGLVDELNQENSVCGVSHGGREEGAAALSRGGVDNPRWGRGSDGRRTAAATAARLSPSSGGRPGQEPEAAQPQTHTAPTRPPCCPPEGELRWTFTLSTSGVPFELLMTIRCVCVSSMDTDKGNEAVHDIYNYTLLLVGGTGIVRGA